jgi:hypothetical protein
VIDNACAASLYTDNWPVALDITHNDSIYSEWWQQKVTPAFGQAMPTSEFPSYWRIHGYPNNLKVPDPQWLAGTDPVAVHVDGNPEFDPTDS